MRPAALTLVLALALSPIPAAAQHAPRLYANTGYSTGSARQLSLGGAFVGIADGGAFTANHASFAQPSPWVDTNLDVFLTLQGSTTLGGQDLDNDRVIDRAAVRQLLLGVGMRYRAFGFGIYARNAEICTNSDCARGRVADAVFGTGGLSVAVAFMEGQLVTAAGLHGTSAALAARPDLTYGGGGLGLDLLWRPTGQPYRVGAVYRPLSVARAADTGAGAPSGTVFPGTLSLGFSAKLDDGREGLNVPRERDDDPTAVISSHNMVQDIFRNRRELPPGRWLATLQLDMTLPVRDAVTLDHFVGDPGGAATRVGGRALLTPRFGVEHVTFPGRLRLRGGTYLEPSPVPRVQPRLHSTFGFDLFLFHYIFDWGVTGAFDVAPRVRQGSVSFGVWG